MNQASQIQSEQSKLVGRILNSDKIIILSSPSGFGKTEVLKLLKLKLAQDSEPPYYFDRYDHGRDPMGAVNEIENSMLSPGSDRRSYIIDDADWADGKALVASIERAIHEKADLRFILATRSLAKLPVARLQANDLVDVIDGTALKLSEKRTKRILSKSVDRRWQKTIGEISGGWPAALQLLAKWVSGIDDVPENWTTLEILKASGFDSYIEQEIVPDFDELTKRALAFVSQFDSWNPALLTATVSDENFDSILPELPYRFAGLIDRAENGTILNPLLRSYFEHRFLELGLDRRRAFLIAGADYQAENGNIAEAARLAKRGGFPDRIERYAADHGTLRIWVTDDYSVIKTLVEEAGAKVVSQSIRLKLMQCIVHMKDGLIKEAESLYQQLASEIDDDHELKSQAEVVRVTLLVYGCNLQRSGDLENFERLFDRGKDDPAWRTLLATLSCILHSQRARFPQALKSLEDARISARLVNSTYNLMFLNLHQAGIHIARGEMKSARTAMTNARQCWRREFFHDRGVQTVIFALSASIEFESGQLTTARNSLKKSAYQMPDSEAWFDIYLAAYEPMVRLIQTDKNTDAALKAIQENQRKLSAHGLPRVESILGGLAICLWGEQRLKGNMSLDRPLDEIPDITSTATWHEREIYTLAQAHLLIDSGEVSTAAELLEAEMAFVTDAELRRSELRYRILLTVIYLRLADNLQAERMMKMAVALGAETGLRQFFVEMVSVDSLYDLLRRIKADGDLDGVTAKFVSRLLSAKERTLRNGNATVLTDREVAILKALAEGGSDKILAREFGISEHGIRFHLKNIYQKLAVHDRMSAVATARKAELV